MRYLLVVLGSLSIVACTISTVAAETLVYIGTYTRGASQGIYLTQLDEQNGSLKPPKLVAELPNPSFVAIHPTRPLLYAVSEVNGDDAKTPGVFAFAIQSDGSLLKLNERSTQGAASCHLSVDPTGRCVGVANYTGGNCITFPIAPDGSLGPAATMVQHEGGSGVNARRQNAPHAHAFNFNADGTQAFVNDLGKDQVLIYDVQPKTAELKPAKQPYLALVDGGGPRHLCFSPDYRLAVANLEMTSQVALLRYDSTRRSLETVMLRSTLPDAASGKNNSTAECLIHPNGRFVYVSNRGHNSIAAFQLDHDPPQLKSLGNTPTGGEIPRGFGIDPSGRFLVVGNQRSGNVVAFAIDQESGKLSPTGSTIEVDSAVNVRFFER